MPVTMELRNDGHVAYYELTDPWIAPDLTSLYPADIHYRDSVPFPVHTVMNVTNAHKVPHNVISVRQNAPAFTHHNTGQLVMIGAHSFVRTMAEMIFRLAHYQRAKF